MLALGVLAPFVAPTHVVAWALLAFVAGVFAAYLPYVPFTDWWYTRFMLPAVPALTVLTVALGGYWLKRADEVSVFRLKALERKYVELGRLASSRLPANVIVVAAQPAESVRFYARKPTLSWAATEPEWLDRVFAECRTPASSPISPSKSGRWTRSSRAFAGTAHRPISAGLRAPRWAT